MLSDAIILSKIGDRLKSIRLKQNITQQSLAEAACVSLPSVKKIEKGEIGSFDSFLRIVRTLGQLDIFIPLIEKSKRILQNNPRSASTFKETCCTSNKEITRLNTPNSYYRIYSPKFATALCLSA